MPNMVTCDDSFSSSSTEVRPKRSNEIEQEDESVTESMGYEVAGVVIPSLSTLLLPIDLLQLSCGFAL